MAVYMIRGALNDGKVPYKGAMIVYPHTDDYSIQIEVRLDDVFRCIKFTRHLLLTYLKDIIPQLEMAKNMAQYQRERESVISRMQVTVDVAKEWISTLEDKTIPPKEHALAFLTEVEETHITHVKRLLFKGNWDTLELWYVKE